ncbi:MKI67 FHA domain-interacting nucleolar phosphoprotein [Spatholobus suberectus]|nr:MKI67 FHA domain-interacting nucleolar phosphoprotein [Spatholobus suberectus]
MDMDSVLYFPRSYQFDTDLSETEGLTHRPNEWRGFNYHYKPLDSVQIERKCHDKVSSSMDKKVYLLDIVRLILSIMFYPLMLSFLERALEEHKKLVEKILKHDQKQLKG